jgi:type IV pilus assembly protein PilB
VGSRRQLTDALVAEGLVDERALEAARAEQARRGGRLPELLVRMGLVGEEAIVHSLARRFRVPGVDLRGKRVEPEVLELVPAEVAEKYACLPLFTKRQGAVQVLYLGMEDPSDLAAVDEVSFRTGLGVQPVVVGPVQLRDALEAAYAAAGADAAGETPPLAEAPLVPGDTAPVLPEPVTGDPTAPVRVVRAPVAPAAAATAAAARPREVPTREILRAVTRLLIQKGVITREELLASVRAIQSGDAPGDD